jgi:hypothetical protein
MKGEFVAMMYFLWCIRKIIDLGKKVDGVLYDIGNVFT